MRKYLQIIDRNKASLGTRFVNNMIDLIILAIIHVVLAIFSNLLYAITYHNFFIFYNNGGFIWDFFLGAVVAFIYFYLWESYSDGKTPGKYLTGTRVISTDGNRPTKKQYLSRSLYRVIPFEALSFFGSEGWHDGMSDTRVINTKNYEAEKQAKSDIENLGSKEIA
ncbi:RDD family protein [Chryseobacterium wangxinyae]|uniref:RDD family protein n=1 Tax=Chryseobacterium sp. CY353 TaxID=2997334 RepID=UPI00226DDFE3|nr:RDD family protein [Chryseobacterium sp. CY353]MCY0968738.1 RDD family protein [Chryseobacterium sp. CY353]